MHKISPGRWGAVCILSTVPTVERLLLGSGKSNKGQEIGSLELQLVCRRTWQVNNNKSRDNLMYMVMPAGFNQKIGLDDKLFVLADSVLVTGLGRIALMPCLVLAARVCPEVTHQ